MLVVTKQIKFRFRYYACNFPVIADFEIGESASIQVAVPKTPRLGKVAQLNVFTSTEYRPEFESQFPATR